MTSPSPVDVVDHAVRPAPSQATHAVRHQRDKVVAATQGSYEGLFTPAIKGVSVIELLLTAFHACRLSKADSAGRALPANAWSSRRPMPR